MTASSNPLADSAFPLTIDYIQPMVARVSAGKYDYVDPDITQENFPLGSIEKNVETVLVHLDRNPSDEEVLAEMERRGLHPATMAELISFGSKYPETQREFQIVAFGSVWVDPHDDRRVGCLNGDSGGRGLLLHWLGHHWAADYYFLAVRK